MECVVFITGVCKVWWYGGMTTYGVGMRGGGVRGGVCVV